MKNLFITLLSFTYTHYTIYCISVDQISLSRVIFDNDWSRSDGGLNRCTPRNGFLELCQECSLTSNDFETMGARYIFFSFTLFGKNEGDLRLLSVIVRSRTQKSSSEVQSRALPFREKRDIIENNFRVTQTSLEFPIPVNHNYFTLTFSSTRDQDCSTVGNPSAFFYQLKQQKSNLTTFPLASAPAKGSMQSILGNCIENAEPFNIVRPRIDLLYNGTFNHVGECRCAGGHFLSGSECRVCSVGEYKELVGNENCTRCGDNTLKTEKNSCPCEKGFYRERNKENIPSAICYAPPSAPVNIKVVNLSNKDAKLSWNITNLGSNVDGTYILYCENCPSERKQPTFKMDGENAKISNLEAFAFYKVAIARRNNVSDLLGKTFPGRINITTLFGAPGPIRKVNVTTMIDEKVVLYWAEPFGRGSPKLKYRIEYDGRVIETNDTSYTIYPEENSVTYNLMIRAVAEVNGVDIPSSSVHSEVVRLKGVIFITPDKDSTSDAPSPGLVGGIAGSTVVFIIILISIIIFLYRKQKRPKHLQIYRMEDGSVELYRGQALDKVRIYVDPTTYSQLDYAVYEFTQELELRDLQIGKILGSGEFAEVFKGSLKKDNLLIDVAIKKLRYDASKRDRDDFISEAAILGQFNDPNVVHLEGVVLKEIPNLIVMELMGNGSLDTFLMKNDQKFTVFKLLGMARGVASGMKYLSQLGYIHRDLAARNILVDKQEICKIADFGMSRELNIDETYSTRGGKIPIKWTAPEAIQLKKFTTSSDVWSYGIVLWEIMSYGQRPYWDWPNFEVVERLATGYRLPPPLACPKVVHDLMLQCWSKDRVKRPLFENILTQIEEWIRKSELLAEKETSTITKTDEEMDYENVMGSLSSWLEAIKMDQHLKMFMERGYTSPRQILNLTIVDLQEIGIAPIGHQKKIFKAIKATKAQVESRKRTVSRTSSTLGYAKSAIGRKISTFTCSFSIPSGSPILEKSTTLETVIDTV